MGSDDGSAVPARVEVLVFSASHGRLRYRSVMGTLGAHRHPDEFAAALAVPPAGTLPAHGPTGPGGARRDGPQPGWAPPSLTLLHSTSWRYVDGGIVLTYAAILDGHPDPLARPLDGDGITRSTDPAAPSPPYVSPDAVAAHAARHLAWLRTNDDVIATALAGLPHLWHCLDEYLPGPAGALDTAPLAATHAG